MHNVGDVGEWVGAAGALLVGAIAAWIGWLQYRNSIFRPDVEVVAEAEPDQNGKYRVAIRVLNRGGAPGYVERVQLLDGCMTGSRWFGWRRGRTP